MNQNSPCMLPPLVGGLVAAVQWAFFSKGLRLQAPRRVIPCRDRAVFAVFCWEKPQSSQKSIPNDGRHWTAQAKSLAPWNLSAPVGWKSRWISRDKCQTSWPDNMFKIIYATSIELALLSLIISKVSLNKRQDISYVVYIPCRWLRKYYYSIEIDQCGLQGHREQYSVHRTLERPRCRFHAECCSKNRNSLW